MRYLLLILVPLIAFGIEDPISPGQALIGKREVVHYPANGETSIPKGARIWFAPPTEDPIVLSRVFVRFSGVEAVGDNVYDTLGVYFNSDYYDVDISGTGDTVYFNRIRPLLAYTEYVVTFHYQYNAQADDIEPNPDDIDSLYFDTLSYRTASDTIPLVVTPLKAVFTDSGTTGSQMLTIYRPFGTTIYCMTPSLETLTVYEPSDTFSVERSRRRITYTLEDIPEGSSEYSFWLTTPEGLETSGTPLVLHYRQRVDGRYKGVISK